MSREILIVDDEAAIRFGISKFLRTAGFLVTEAATCRDAEVKFSPGAFEAVLLDYRLTDGDSFPLLSSFKRADPGLPVVMLTGLVSIELAVEAMKRGADHFVTKPVEHLFLKECIERLIEGRRARSRAAVDSLRSEPAMNPFIGSSAGMRELEIQARNLLDSDSPILILGETGVGKGVLANWLHQNSLRRDEAFVDFNCAGISRELFESELFGHERGAFTGAVTAKTGLLEVGNRGTFFLDEIGDVDIAVQPKLLKVVEEKRFRRVGDVKDRSVDVKFVAATHRDLGKMRQAGTFRDDLYFRLSALPLRIPALRERHEDIVPIARAILENLGARRGRRPQLDGKLEPILTSYAWPGNLRELRNVLERTLLLSASDRIERLALEEQDPPPTRAIPSDPSLSLGEVERRHIVHVLDAADGRVDTAARILGISRSSLYNRLREYGIVLPKFPRR